MFKRENLEEIMSIFEGTPILDTKLCHIGSGLDLSFSKLSNFMG